jgi:methyl-accepting chemotaxis protein
LEGLVAQQEMDVALLRSIVDTPDERAWAEGYITSYGSLRTILESEILPALGQRGTVAAQALRASNSKLTGAVESADEYISKISLALANENEASDVAFDGHRQSAVVTLFLVLLVGIAVSIGISIFAARALTRPILAVIHSIDNADLNSQFNDDRKDEIGTLLRSFDRFVASIRETLVQVSESSAAVASASSQISSSTEEMAAGAQEQTSQAAEVASAVEEMAKTIVENSRNASQTAETAKQAKHAAEQGGAVVKDTLDAIGEIAASAGATGEIIAKLGKSSEQIGEIIGVINDIADQTNLLALNAAIEAARAGEQGRGFAVVADEVRKLAERTTKATKEIAGMIKGIQNDTGAALDSMVVAKTVVERGTAKASAAGSSLAEIVAISQRVTDMVNQIAAASEQQSTASEQISKNVEAISAVTGETASGTQQVARAAEDLNRLTEGLRDLVARFQLTDEASQVHAHPASRAHVEPKASAGRALAAHTRN